MNTDINLNDLRTAFAYKNSRELKYTWFIYYIISKPFFVKLLKSLTRFSLKYKLPVKAIIRKTVFEVFCAGESRTEAFQTIRKLHDFHVRSVLDYVSEAEETNNAFESNTCKIIENIRMSSEGGTKCDFISIKLSGLETSEHLAWLSAGSNRCSDSRYGILSDRLKRICSAAANNNIQVYIDAEESWTQAVTDHLAEEMMRLFNKERVIVFNTLQMYRTDRVEYLKGIINQSMAGAYKAGIKLVRGAYHEKEIQMAMNQNREIPVFLSKEETDAAFNRAIDICFSTRGRVCTCIATHNEQSILYAIKAIDRYAIKDHNTAVQFSQLFGMSDNITFNLAAKGFNASKYLPYGEVEKAIPYLMRRADENTSVNGQMTREFKLLSLEMKRRSSYYA